MCNQPTLKNKKNNEKIHQDYRFLDYRLQQLEQKIDKGLTQIEQEQKQYNLEVMKTLQKLQEGQNQTTETIAQLQQRIITVEKNNKYLEKLKESAHTNTTAIKNVNHRVDVIQRILFAVGGAAISALFTAIISIALLLIQIS